MRIIQRLGVVAACLGGLTTSSVQAQWEPVEPPELEAPSEWAGLLALGPRDVWAAGSEDGPDGFSWSYEPGAKNAGRPVLQRWDGTAWRRTELPDWHGELHAVTALGKDDVWVAGVDAELQPGRVMMLHYDGRSWTREFLRSAGTVHKLNLARVPGTSQLWLTNSRGPGYSDKPVVFRRR
ncbi:hypothetical protein [Nonomuraea helvata]|uniref:Secreted protein n=1 Tax=Nonomuraea helvata TaxID=37484 RepID=A0ABV5SIY5_9ACTN